MADGLSLDPSVSDTLMFGSRYEFNRIVRKFVTVCSVNTSLSVYSLFMVAERWFYDDC